ncbi:armadillo repeat-containing protein 1-like isoform X1 [Spea bombifrons]|uniref:armadillo repeat-containing protein 1-like isoform X1 n=1 Tax=Spea bombifrons TaxID=233779 RepID=UPI00234C01DF|nr:armadillo repeat-containing protein 1-like isoform X1 [Spea bombifrons]
MDALSVVTHLKDLSSDPLNRTSIVKDKSCLAGLILFLSHQEIRVVECALKTIAYLCENPCHHEIMRNELGMMVSLDNIRNRHDIADEIRQVARNIHSSLKPPVNVYTPESNLRKTKHQFFISSSIKRAKTITLHIHGLDNVERKNILEEALLRVKGVISFTFQIAMKRCTIRVKSDLTTESLASVIAETRVLQAQQVIKNESGNEIYVPLPKTDLPVEKNSCLPDYLPEEESPQKDVEKAITCPGLKESSGGSWINTAANFLTKTFYW